MGIEIRRVAAAGLVILLGWLGCNTSGGAEVGESDPAISASAWLGTTWRVEEIEGRSVTEGVTSTLGFPEPGRVAGRAACNRYTGSVVLDGDRILSLGPLAATRMMCEPPVMDQEQRFLGALERARELKLSGDRLLVFAKDGPTPLLQLAPMEPDENR